MDYHDKKVLVNLNVCIAMKHKIGAGARWKTKSVKAVVPENINTVRELIIQDVIYREVELLWDISPTNIHSILHEHLAVEKICSR